MERQRERDRVRAGGREEGDRMERPPCSYAARRSEERQPGCNPVENCSAAAGNVSF